MRLSEQTKGELSILFCQVCLGLRFVSVKAISGIYAPSFITGARFLMGGLVLFAVMCRKIRWSAVTLRRGFIMGCMLGVAMWLQTCGLQFSSASKSAYISSASVVLVPLLNCLLFRVKPGFWQGAAALICFTGVVVMTVHFPFYIEWGDGILLLGAFMSASTSIYSSRSVRTPGTDSTGLSVVQMTTIGVLWLLPTAVTGNWPTCFEVKPVLLLLYSGLIGAGLCNTLAISAYRVTTVNRSSLIVSTQPVFATLFSILFLGERLSPRLLLGAAMVFGATLLTIFARKPALPAAGTGTKG